MRHKTLFAEVLERFIQCEGQLLNKLIDLLFQYNQRCALARFSFVTNTRAKAQNNIKRSGPFLRRDLVPLYSAIDTRIRK